MKSPVARKRAHGQVAREAADQAVTRQNAIRLNSQQSREFVEALLAPSRPPTNAMKRAIQRYGCTVTEA